jgi:cytidyltransferase-like protein
MKVLTIGTFDLLHTGHRYLMSRAAAFGELTVGVNSDRFVSEYKGEPVQSEDARMRKIEALADVADVRLNDGPGRELIEAVEPQLLVVGGDWMDRDYLAQIDCTRELLEDLGCDLLFVSRLAGYSTTALRRSSVSAIVVTHANPDGAYRMIGNLLAQTRPPDEIILVATETPRGILNDLASYETIRVETIDEVGDWGHAKRAHGLELATGDWVGFFNDDDAYLDDYLERMLVAATGDVDVVYCEWNENPGCDFAIYQSTAGNFIVRRELAQKVGWTERRYEADGDFIEALKAAGASVGKVDEILYHHNAEEVPA